MEILGNKLKAFPATSCQHDATRKSEDRQCRGLAKELNATCDVLVYVGKNELILIMGS